MDIDKVQMITFNVSRTFVIPGLGSGRWNTDGRQLVLKLDPDTRPFDCNLKVD
jgi:hypothetical protein